MIDLNAIDIPAETEARGLARLAQGAAKDVYADPKKTAASMPVPGEYTPTAIADETIHPPLTPAEVAERDEARRGL